MTGLADTQSIITAEQMAALDTTALESAQLPECVYSALKQAANQYGDQVAIKYLLDGQCLGPKKIPLKKYSLKVVVSKGFRATYFFYLTFIIFFVMINHLANFLLVFFNLIT